MERSKLSHEYQKTLASSELVLGLLGMQVIYETRANGLIAYFRQNWFYVITSLVLYVCVAGEFIYFGIALGDFQNFLEVTELAPCIGFCLLGLSKMYAVSSRRVIVQKLVLELGAIWPEGDASPMDTFIKEKYLRWIYFVQPRFTLLFTVLIWLYNLFPLMEMSYHAIMSNVVEYDFPYFVWYPFDPMRNNWVYGIIYITQIWDGDLLCMFSGTGCIAACGNVGPDLLLVVMTSHICMMFEILGHHALVLLDDSEMLDESVLSERLDKLIQWHQRMLEFAEDLDSIFSFVILINFTGGSLIICLVGFQLTANDTKQTVKFLLFLSSSLVEVLLICWYGEQLIDTSSSVAHSVYNSQWYCSNIHLRKRLTYMLQRSQKPSVITALKFSTVSLRSFTTILSKSWSYFTLLRTIYDPSNNDM